MKSLFNRNTEAQAAETPARPTALMLAERACCCPGKPVVIAMVPPHAADLLLCGHHFRGSRDALREAGATVYDEHGQVIMGPGSVDPRPGWEFRSVPQGISPAMAHPADRG